MLKIKVILVIVSILLAGCSVDKDEVKRGE